MLFISSKYFYMEKDTRRGTRSFYKVLKRNIVKVKPCIQPNSVLNLIIEVSFQRKK